jgi:KaiC/GvpD/RAD55 family RecA-like ATPase
MAFDFEKALISALLADGTPAALHKVLAKGITSEMLRNDDGSLAQFDFIRQYATQYNELPPIPLVEARTGVIVSPLAVGGAAEFWADELKNKELTSLLRKWSDQVRTDISNMEPQAGYEHWLECVREVRSQKVVGSAVESIPALFGGVLEYYDMIKTGGRGILTPWRSLNEATLGLWPGDLALFVARTGVGKTWVMILLAHYVWKELGKRILFATTEMSKNRIALRVAALYAGVSYDMMRKGQLPTQPINIEQNFRNALESAKDAEGLYVVGGDFNFTLEGLEGAIEEIKPDLMIMDGAYLLKAAGANRIERAANAFDDLKRLTIRQNIPCAVTTQFNREVKTNSAASVKSESIALTDVAAWNADLIVGLVQTEDMRRDGRMIFKPLKGRESVCEDFETNWDLNRMKFDELPKAASSFAGSGDADDDDFGSLGIGGAGGTGGAPPTNSGIPF